MIPEPTESDNAAMDRLGSWLLLVAVAGLLGIGFLIGRITA
jgi:hypothetical protein